MLHERSTSIKLLWLLKEPGGLFNSSERAEAMRIFSFFLVYKEIGIFPQQVHWVQKTLNQGVFCFFFLASFRGQIIHKSFNYTYMQCILSNELMTTK